jgi:hypothetical protein
MLAEEHFLLEIRRYRVSIDAHVVWRDPVASDVMLLMSRNAACDVRRIELPVNWQFNATQQD